MTFNIRFISAGAGSGKTYRLTEVLKEAVTSGSVRPAGVIGMTFTKKAAAELRERVRQHLFQAGRSRAAVQMGQALLGTVNSVCGHLLERFAFELGLSPELEVIPEEEGQALFDQILEAAVSLAQVRRMNEIGGRLDLQDWKKVVKNIVDAARANNMPPGNVAAYGRENANELLGFFAAPESRDFSGGLLAAMDEAITGIEANEDSTKTSRNYLSFLRQVRLDVAEDRLKWSQWVKLSKDKPAKRSLDLAEKVIEAARHYDAHPLFHEDIQGCCEIVFSAAANALEAYQEFKQKRGLIDFVDQEQILLKALDSPEIFTVLKEELELLLVDEFQDTSPIQLALFLKLASAAKETVFVGDVKQAIYGFRGSDPELMEAVLEAVEQQGAQTEVLGKSWRSRRHLVDYTSDVFCTAFSETIPEDQVRLSAVRCDPEGMTEDTAVEHWALQGSNVGKRSAALAEGVRDLIESGRKVIDPATQKPRQLRYDDIAVLARTHLQIDGLAEAFSKAEIPVNMERPGLLSTPEACLVLACLRRLADSSDTLASAEIIALSQCEEPENWLSHRLEYLAAGKDSWRWGEDGNDYPLLKVLSESRERLLFFSPSEALECTIDLADIRRTAISWGPNSWKSGQRLNNIDGLVELSRQYEEHCRAQRLAATVSGLLLWFYDLQNQGKDVQPKDPTGNAVHLLTHHGAKGLEWPVVIATELTGDLWRRLWDLNVVSEAPQIDLTDPLAGRSLRYWPWPFGQQKKGIPVVDKIETSDWGIQSLKRDTEEAKRLLYVSLTRARDLLVIPFPENRHNGPWIDSLGVDWMVPDNSKLCLPCGSEIPTAMRVFAGPETTKPSSAPYAPFWFPERAEATDKLVAQTNPSALPGITSARIASEKTVGRGIAINGRPDMNALGQVIHSAIAAEIIDPGNEGYPDLVKQLLQAADLVGYVDVGDVVHYVKAFHSSVRSTFKPQRMLAEYPMVHRWENGQLARGWIDVLIGTEKGWIVLDHKITRRSEDPNAVVQRYSGQLAEYKNAVQAATGKIVESCWLHLPLNGELIMVDVSSSNLPTLDEKS